MQRYFYFYTAVCNRLIVYILICINVTALYLYTSISVYICNKQGIKKGLLKQSFDYVGTDLVSRAVTSQVSSTRMSLTSVFGMGTGVTSLP